MMGEHAAILTIDLEALRANWRLLAKRGGGAETGAAVKADAYGLGIETVVPALLEAGCRSFFVAHLSEGLRVRAVAPQAAIYVLNGLAEASLADYRHHRLRPVLGSAREIGLWKDQAGEPAALHVDTGMNRLGMRRKEAFALIRDHRLADLGIGLVMSHFASSEYSEAADTRAQIAAFAELAKVIQAPDGLNRETSLSLWNSSAHFIDGAAPYTLTRPGYALYGGNPTPGKPNPMRPVIRLEAEIVQINHVPAGEAVGYNGNFVARRDSRIATISCGYGDGLPRNLGNRPGHPGGIARVAGRECPFAGNVSMDLITIDITDLPEDAAMPGDLVTLIDEELTIERVGATGDTIGYEILTSLGKRYRRITIG